MHLHASARTAAASGSLSRSSASTKSPTKRVRGQSGTSGAPGAVAKAGIRSRTRSGRPAWGGKGGGEGASEDGGQRARHAAAAAVMQQQQRTGAAQRCLREVRWGRGLRRLLAAQSCRAARVRKRSVSEGRPRAAAEASTAAKRAVSRPRARWPEAAAAGEGGGGRHTREGEGAVAASRAAHAAPRLHIACRKSLDNALDSRIIISDQSSSSSVRGLCGPRAQPRAEAGRARGVPKEGPEGVVKVLRQGQAGLAPRCRNTGVREFRQRKNGCVAVAR